MFAFFKAVQFLRLTLIGVRAVASLIIIGHGIRRWFSNKKREEALA